SSGLHREESRCTLENVPLVPEHPILPPQPPQLFALLSRQTLARSRVDGRLFNPAADRRLAEVHLPTNRRDRPVTPLHQGNDLRLERGRERSPWSAPRPLLLHLLPHSNTLLVGLRPHLGCSPVGGKATRVPRAPRRPTMVALGFASAVGAWSCEPGEAAQASLRGQSPFIEPGRGAAAAVGVRIHQVEEFALQPPEQGVCCLVRLQPPVERGR